jgi:hypothetical protein
MPKGQAAKEIGRLHDRRRDLQRRQRKALQARDSARDERDRLDEEVKATEARALALDQTANTKRDRTRLVKLADQAAEHDRSVTALDAALAAIEGEIRTRARGAYDELLDEAVADHEQAREQIIEALQLLGAARARARGAYTAAQAVAANAGAMHVTASLHDIPSIEGIVGDGGLEPLIHPHDRDVIAA